MLWRLLKTLIFTAVVPGTVSVYLPQALKYGGTELAEEPGWRRQFARAVRRVMHQGAALDSASAARMTTPARLLYTASDAI